MEIAEAHRKVHNELEENVSQFKFNFQFGFQQLKEMRCKHNHNYIDYLVKFNYQAKMCQKSKWWKQH